MSSSQQKNKTSQQGNIVRKKPNIIRRMYDWTMQLAEHPQAIWALFFLAVSEAIFFPIPTDILLLAMAMAMPSRALWYAFISTTGSVIGAGIGYWLGFGLWAKIDDFFYRYIPSFSEESYAQMAEQFANNTFATIFTAGFSPLPFKVFALAAGAAAVPIIAFLLGALISRGLRYGILAGLIMWFGPTVKTWIDKHFNTVTIVGTLLLLVGFYFYQQAH